nr:hypothetical protein [uncultured Dysosmobacter sp.]
MLDLRHNINYVPNAGRAQARLSPVHGINILYIPVRWKQALADMAEKASAFLPRKAAEKRTTTGRKKKFFFCG